MRGKLYCEGPRRKCDSAVLDGDLVPGIMAIKRALAVEPMFRMAASQDWHEQIEDRTVTIASTHTIVRIGKIQCKDEET